MNVFGLGGMLRLRALREDEAAVALGAAERDVARARDRARTTAERLAGSTLPGSADGATFLAAAASRLSLSSLLVEDTDRLREARGVAAERREHWSHARQDERAVELLEEHHEERVRVEELRAEQVVLDEVAGRRREEER